MSNKNNTAKYLKELINGIDSDPSLLAAINKVFQEALAFRKIINDMSPEEKNIFFKEKKLSVSLMV